MRDYPNPNDLDVSILLLFVIVILLLLAIWWVEDWVERGRAGEQEAVDRAPLSPEEKADVERWLGEGRG